MEKQNFQDAVEALVARDPRFKADAYGFLREALTATMNDLQRKNEDLDPHVSGPELLEGFRDLALQRFGPMTNTVMEEWGLSSCEDIGTMVFLLIDAGVFGKSDTDSPSDFSPLLKSSFADCSSRRTASEPVWTEGTIPPSPASCALIESVTQTTFLAMSDSSF